MIKTLQQIIMLKSTIVTNTFLYYLKRLWVIGKRVPDSVYGNHDLKVVLAVLFTILGQVVSLGGKALYIVLFAVLPALLTGTAQSGVRFDSLVQILFFLSCIMGPLQDSVVFKVTKEKFTAVRYMKMNVEKYTKVYLLYHYVPFALYFLICVLAASWITGGGILGGICLWFVIIMMRAAGEAFQVWLFDRKGIVFSRKTGWTWTMIFLSVIGAYTVFVPWGPFLTAKRLFHPIPMVIIGIVGMVSVWYLMAGYRGYRQKLHRTVEEKWLFSSIIKQTNQESNEKSVGMREQDLQADSKKMAGVEKLHGYEYFNALFFLRHRRMILKPVYYRLAGIGIFFLGGVVLRIAGPDVAYLAAKGFPDFLPILVFIMYMMTVADKACKAMFYNCDKSMLKFGFYRNPRTLLSNFRIRLVKIAEYDLVLGAAVCVAVAGFRGICGIWEFGQDMLLFCVAVLVLSVFFTVHHLFLYYVFQPYSEEMNVKNPFFQAINMAVYLVCFLCYELQVNGVLKGSVPFIIVVLAVTILYIVVALNLVYRYAPKTFRVK
nr:hypothetical protein [uncultured Sellimonas sp.]